MIKNNEKQNKIKGGDIYFWLLHSSLSRFRRLHTTS